MHFHQDDGNERDMHAIRLIEQLDWAVLRDGGVQVITGFGTAPAH